MLEHRVDLRNLIERIQKQVEEIRDGDRSTDILNAVQRDLGMLLSILQGEPDESRDTTASSGDSNTGNPRPRRTRRKPSSGSN